jgi:hypothetical protein
VTIKGPSYRAYLHEQLNATSEQADKPQRRRVAPKTKSSKAKNKSTRHPRRR